MIKHFVDICDSHPGRISEEHISHKINSEESSINSALY